MTHTALFIIVAADIRVAANISDRTFLSARFGPLDERLLIVFIIGDFAEETLVLLFDYATLASNRDGCQDVVTCGHNSLHFALSKGIDDTLSHVLHLVLHDQEPEECQVRLNFFPRHCLNLSVVCHWEIFHRKGNDTIALLGVGRKHREVVTRDSLRSAKFEYFLR